MSTDYEIKKTNKVKQLKLKATYNKKIVHEILDAGLVAYVAFSQDDGPSKTIKNLENKKY